MDGVDGDAVLREDFAAEETGFAGEDGGAVEGGLDVRKGKTAQFYRDQGFILRIRDEADGYATRARRGREAGDDPVEGIVAAGIEAGPAGPGAIDADGEAEDAVFDQEGERLAFRGSGPQEAQAAIGVIDLGDAALEEIDADQSVDGFAAESRGVVQIDGEIERAEGKALRRGDGGQDFEGCSVGFDTVNRFRPAEGDVEAAGGCDAENRGAGAGIEKERDWMRIDAGMDENIAVHEMERDIAGRGGENEAEKSENWENGAHRGKQIARIGPAATG